MLVGRAGQRRSLSPKAATLKEFVVALLEVGDGWPKQNYVAQVSLMEWRHHSYETTAKGLRDAAMKGPLGTSIIDKLVSQTGNPLAVRDWQSERGHVGSAPTKHLVTVEAWSLDRIREELIRQEIARWWPEQAMRIIAFATARDSLVLDLDYEKACRMGRSRLGKQIRDLGTSQFLERTLPATSKARPVSVRPLKESALVKPNQRFDKWLSEGAPWIRAAKLHGSEYREALKDLFEAGRTWPNARRFKMPTPPNPEWLDEILARAEDLAPLLRFEPEWPMSFGDKRYQVSISVVDQTLVAWVEVGRAKTLLSVDLETLSFKGKEGKKDSELAVGLAVSWYLDSCICLRKRGHRHFKASTIGSKARSSVSRPGITYVPTPRFLSDVTATKHGTRNPPRAHRVKGHVRELSETHSPSDKARNNAPSYIQRHLRHNETFVRSHSRGKGGRSRVMSIYLSKFSTLADALGSL